MARKKEQISDDFKGNESSGAKRTESDLQTEEKKPAEKFEFSQAIARLFSVIQILSGLRHAQYTIRFVSNTSIEAVLHYGLQKICTALEVRHFVSDLIEVFFYVSIILLAANILIDLVYDSITAIKSRFFNKK